MLYDAIWELSQDSREVDAGEKDLRTTISFMPDSNQGYILSA